MTPPKARTAEAMRASGDHCRVEEDAPTGESVAFQIIHTRFERKERGGESKVGTKNLSLCLHRAPLVDVGSESPYGSSPQSLSAEPSTTVLEASLALTLLLHLG